MLTHFWLRRRRKIIEKIATAARRHTPPATPTPIPALAPVERDDDEAAAVGLELLEDVVLLVVELVVELVDEVEDFVDCEVEDEEGVGEDEDDEGRDESDNGGGVSLGKCAQPSVDGSGFTPGKIVTASVGAALS